MSAGRRIGFPRGAFGLASSRFIAMFLRSPSTREPQNISGFNKKPKGRNKNKGKLHRFAQNMV
jgi:hypothetical protein